MTQPLEYSVGSSQNLREQNLRQLIETLKQADVVMLSFDLDGVIFSRYDEQGRIFDEERGNAERERVLREIADSKSSPEYLSNIEFNTLLYRGHPKGRFVLGKEEVVRKADYNKIKDFLSFGSWIMYNVLSSSRSCIACFGVKPLEMAFTMFSASSIPTPSPFIVISSSTSI